MAELSIELDRDLLEAVRRLALLHYGDCADASVARVVEVALEMRLYWQGRANAAGDDIDEPVTKWEFAGAASPIAQLPHDVENMLFRRRGDASVKRSH